MNQNLFRKISRKKFKVKYLTNVFLVKYIRHKTIEQIETKYSKPKYTFTFEGQSVHNKS